MAVSTLTYGHSSQASSGLRAMDGSGGIRQGPGAFRPVLVERELCIVALLAVLDVPKQLYSHLRGALNVGADVGKFHRRSRLDSDMLRMMLLLVAGKLGTPPKFACCCR
ncbi:MAG: hypothetical protein CM1200mP14_22600 [Gammaproteobacteria bacterium]|nr:MAG: hypothetical protein CM1200mP14_22600 [Gammaproteobacteria bacterium]